MGLKPRFIICFSRITRIFWKSVRCDPRGLPNAESHAERCLSLPCHPQLHDDDVAKIIATINQFE